jgi:nucleoside-diphosphate-sugar epimerase
MRVLIAGATGVIGRRLVPLLLADGHEVTQHLSALNWTPFSYSKWSFAGFH